MPSIAIKDFEEYLNKIFTVTLKNQRPEPYSFVEHADGTLEVQDSAGRACAFFGPISRALLFKEGPLS